ncbi:hypothetical protein KJ966_12065 [bacterium]|nr:hypothetical protein [bacterium]
MKSITIHGLSEELDEMIRKKAERQNTSLNKTIKALLEEALGLNKKGRPDRSKDFDDLFGIWTKQDAEEFKNAIAQFEEIDQQDWK